MSTPFTGNQMRLLQDAQRALLSVETASSLDTWTETIFQVLRPLLNTDRLYYLQPSHLPSPLSSLSVGNGPSVSLAAPGGSQRRLNTSLLDSEGESLGDDGRVSGDGAPAVPQASLIIRSLSLGDDFAGGINRHFVGFEDGFSIFREAYPTTMHRLVRAAGPGAVHDAPLYDPKLRKKLDLYQEVFRPVRLVRQMALAQPLPKGEALLIAGFAETCAPAYNGARHQIMQILAPVFSTSLKLQWQFREASRQFTTMIDQLPEALIAFDAGGNEHYRNRAFQDLPLGESDRDTLLRAANQLAAEVGTTLRANASSEPLTGQRDLSLSSDSYNLRAFIAPSMLSRPGVLVWVERDALLPPPGALQERYGLTPRQAEVALLMAQGRSDRNVAEELFISPHTARRHAEAVLKKMNLPSRAGVALACVQTPPSK